MARLAIPQLSVAQRGWQRDFRHPGVSSTPQIHLCEEQQDVACCFFTQFSSEIYSFWGSIMYLKEVVQTRRIAFLCFIKGEDNETTGHWHCYR